MSRHMDLRVGAVQSCGVLRRRLPTTVELRETRPAASQCRFSTTGEFRRRSTPPARRFSTTGEFCRAEQRPAPHYCRRAGHRCRRPSRCRQYSVTAAPVAKWIRQRASTSPTGGSNPSRGAATRRSSSGTEAQTMKNRAPPTTAANLDLCYRDSSCRICGTRIQSQHRQISLILAFHAGRFFSGIGGRISQCAARKSSSGSAASSIARTPSS